MRALATAVIDRLFLVVYGAGAPTDDEWSHYLKLVDHHGIERTMQLIVTEGGEPTRTQRRQLNDLLDGRSVRVAVLTDSALTRGTVNVLSWFNDGIRAFPSSRLKDALAYLEIPVSRQELIVRRLDVLRREIAAS